MTLDWDGGLGTSFLVDPARDLAVIALTQRMFETRSRPEQSARHAQDFSRK